MGTCSGCGAWFCNDRSQHTEVSTFFAFGTCAACATYCASCGQPDVYAGCNGPCPCLEDGFDEQSESGEGGDGRSDCSEGSEAYAALEPPPPGGSELPSSDTSRVPGDVFPRLEFKYPLLWYHSRFAWSAAEQECTLRARATVGTRLPLCLPAVSYTHLTLPTILLV